MAHLAEAGKLSLEDLREMESLLTDPDSTRQETDLTEKEPGGSSIRTSRIRR